MNKDRKSVFLTGGSKGIGEGTVYSLAKAGFNIVFTHCSDIESASEVCNKSRAFLGNVSTVKMDLGDRNSIKQAINFAVEELGAINILINNAAIAQEKPFETITDSDWENMLSANLQGPYRAIQEVIPSMIENKWGRIINIASIGGQWGGFNQVHYAAAKAGLINLTQSIAKIYSKDGITSNAISPGLVATDMSKDELNTQAGKEKVKGIPIKRLGTVEEIGATVLFLSQEESSYITGQTINLNGGMFFS